MLFGTIIGILIVFILGDLIIRCFDRKSILSLPERLAAGFLIGQGILTLVIFWLLFLKIPKLVYITGGIIVLIYSWMIIRNKEYLSVKHLKPAFSWPGRAQFKRILITLLIAMITLKLAYVFVEAVSKPEYSWDACANWTLQGKHLFYLYRTLPDKISDLWIVSSSYPKQLPMMHFWLFSWMNDANDQWSKLFFPVSLACFSVYFYYSLKCFRGKLGALLFIYFLLSAPFLLYHSTIGYADFSLAICFASGIISFFRWVKGKQGLYFWLFAAFMGQTTWIKLEGKTMYLLGLALLLIYLWQNHSQQIKEAISKLGQYTLSYVIFGLPWQLFIIVNHLPTRECFAWHIKYFLELHLQMYTKLFIEGSWGILWVAIFAIMLISLKALLSGDNRFLLFAFLLFYVMILFIYLLTYDAYGWFEVTFNRVWLSVYPIAVFIAGYLLPKIKIGNDMEL